MGAYKLDYLEELDYPNNFIEAVKKLPNTPKYMCVNDLQGGDFGKYRFYGPRDWVLQAIEWLDVDGSAEEAPFWILNDPAFQISDFWQIHLEPAVPIFLLWNRDHPGDIITIKKIEEEEDYYKSCEMYDKVVDYWWEKREG